VLVLATLAASAPAPGQPGVPSTPRVLDDFERDAGWTAHPSDGVSLRISRDEGRTGKALRLDFDFRGGGGYAIARKVIPVDLPENYELAFWIRGDAPVNTLEFKLLADERGENVWWVNRRDFRFPREWTRLVTKKRHVTFAWGPSGGGELRHVAAVELVITASTGGKGTVWIDDFTLTPREPVRPYAGTPVARASSAAGGDAAARAIDGDTATAWRSAAGGAQRLDIDFGQSRELGGLVLRWAPGRHAPRYEVLTSPDGERWERAHLAEESNGGADWVWLPETETRWLRLTMSGAPGGQGYALREVEVQPIDWAASRTALLERVAGASPRGAFPKYLLRTQSYWTIIGADGDTEEGLVNEEGMVEIAKATASIEPFLHTGDRLLTWADARPTQRLERGDLPIPSVRWEGAPLELEVTAFAAGAEGKSSVWARYRVRNPGRDARRATLYLAIRPLQVNPSWQFLSTIGGAGRIERAAWEGGVASLNDGAVRVVPVTAPAGFGAATWDQGDVSEWLRAGRLPPRQVARDAHGLASAALAYPMALGPGESRDVWVAAPLHAASPVPRAGLASAAAARLGDSTLAAAVREWSRRLDVVRLTIPGDGARLARTIRSTLAYIHINRDGPSIQPGSRSYERSWIRDGSLTSEALLRLGQTDAVRRFVEWYAPFQFENGKVPCCVDRRGADPVPENDSHGQLIFLIAEYWRFTGDTAFLRRMYPHVTRAVAYIDSLRRSRMTPVYRGDSVAYHGLLPQSISHEGYSAKPMHSFWDDFFGLKGLKDAAAIAHALGDAARARDYAAMRDDFRRSILESFRRSMAMHGIDYLPGAVELGDFDATSTTVGITPAGELAHLPRQAVERTFDRYWEFVRARAAGDTAWEAYTPYEWRTVGTFIRLGRLDRAHALADFFFDDRRPRAWNHWAEVVWNDSTAPKFIGDMPHTWVGSDFIRSALDILAYERESDSSLVVGAGVRPEWVRADTALAVEALRTHYGPLSLTMRADGDAVRVRLSGELRVPPGGIVVRAPLARAPRSATVDGRPAALASGGEVVVRRVPSEIVYR
jgi:hypothetical protein